MILHFSGTGNSEYVAKRLAKEIGDEEINVFSKIRSSDYTTLNSSLPFVVVCPTYSWRIPRILEKWLEATELSGNSNVYFVMTCGGNIGNAGAYCEKLCRKKGLTYMGCKNIVMPENYIAMFRTPSTQEASSIILEAEQPVIETAKCIIGGKPFSKARITLIDKLSSGIINDAFYRLFISAKKFRSTDKCSSCGKCVSVCPLSNISLTDGKPVWGQNCTHCMACINRCPKEAIEYGRHSKGLPRYVCPK